VNFRRLGDSDLEVSEISLGSWLTYGAGVEREHTEACTRAAFNAGINFFDTSNIYGVGQAEAVWGEILPDYPRDSYVLATKLYFPLSETDRGLSREQVHKQLDASLDAYGPTTWTSTSAIARTPRRRSRRRWRR
jgi:1-deoxyxylulose-5-phosphate synthase